MRPDRVVIGVEAERARDMFCAEIYRPLYLIETPIVFTKPETAEIIKYAANAFLATKITFINEIANLCEEAGGDVQVVAKALGLDGRIGSQIPPCRARLWRFVLSERYQGAWQRHRAELTACRRSIVETVIRVNDARQLRTWPHRIVKALRRQRRRARRIAILGISFKPKTDDIREAPSLTIIPLPCRKPAPAVVAFDPGGDGACEKAAARRRLEDRDPMRHGGRTPTRWSS